MNEKNTPQPEIVNIDIDDLKVQSADKAQAETPPPQPEPAAKREKVKIEKRPKEPETTTAPVVIKQGFGVVVFACCTRCVWLFVCARSKCIRKRSP